MENMTLKIEGASMYSFTDDKSGRLVQGVNVFHMVKGSYESNSVGLIPSKISLPFETWERISNYPFPSEFEIVTSQVLSRKGIVTKVTDIVPVKK